MNRIGRTCLGVLIAISILIALMHPCASIADACDKWVAKAVSIQGSVQVRRAGETQWQTARLNETYCSGDTIRVLDRSRADIALVNQPVLRLDQDTTITLRGLKEERSSLIELVKGAAHFFSRAVRSLEVYTAFVNAGVEGTEFFVKVEGERTFLSVFEGKVLASNQNGSLAITSGQSAVAESGKAPELRVVVRPRDAVQWTLYYPPVLYYRSSDIQGLPEPVQAMFNHSIESYRKRDFKGALEGIAGLPEDLRDPRPFSYRASLLLSVGRVDQAKADIEKALHIAPNHCEGLALLSIIAVVQNEKGKALDFANRAVGADPKSASALIALSYAEQANFNLQRALSSLKEAVRASPENALAWARLSEMWLSFGEINKAFKAAKQAAELSPDLARVQTVLGFAYLTEIKIRESEKAFEKAVELDQADPLPRLGLGLAKIRDGDLKEGSREIEVAASLDPNNSLIRSYLGKAYYEDKRDKLASDEYKMAKEFDPLDPTPFFYDAILKQTTNQPVEALHEYEKAIELNDHRAVYRSRMLLDSDLAARSASIARIYNDLGFQQRALVEGWRSVNTDPANFSGHRFLADTYAALPRHEIARVSELLQSQLLQPLNITPIQPRLAESNLLLISSGGPADLSFNEFNPLFTRNRIALQATGLAGENSTFGEEVIVSGIYNMASFSVGQSYNQTDGFRDNAFLKDNIVDAFAQVSLTPQTSVQGEFRYRNTRGGDLGLRFFPDDFAPRLQDNNERSSIRFGFHHVFSPGSDLIGNFMYQHQDYSQHDLPDPFLVYSSDKYDANAFSAELQYLFRSKFINLVGGAGYFNIDSSDQLLWMMDFPPLTPVPSAVDRKIDHTNLYLYSYVNFPKNVTFTVGASADFFQGGDTDKNQFNPKFGMTWNPIPETTLRAAAFRVLKRTLITNQTLEPTQVAGFNQFYDDWNETESWRYGVAIDQKFSQSIYGGAEFSYRDLEFPYTDFSGGSPVVRKEDWREWMGRAYAYWTPHKWFGLSAEYLYERFTRDIEFALGLKRVDTQRVPLTINFYHPSGFSAMLKGTYVNQQGKFERQFPFATGVFEKGDAQFWLFDAAISYRLPKRFGFITVGAKNLFDKSFKYFDTDPVSPAIQPDRMIYGKVTLSF
jgi:tetratricopeptide (TPR) repeat protein